MLNWFAKRLQELQKAKRDEKGFTLIELLVVVIIIGILAAIAIPTFLSQREKSQNAQALSSARSAASVVQTLAVDCNGLYKKTSTTNCDTKLVSADITTADAALNEPSAPTLAVADDFKSYTVKYTSDSGKIATFNSVTGQTTLGTT